MYYFHKEWTELMKCDNKSTEVLSLVIHSDFFVQKYSLNARFSW